MIDKNGFRLEQSHQSQVPGGAVRLTVSPPDPGETYTIKWSSVPETKDPFDPKEPTGLSVVWTAPKAPDVYRISVEISSEPPPEPYDDGGDDGGDDDVVDAPAAAASPAVEPVVLQASVEVTPMALPLELVGAIGEGVKALKDGLPGSEIRLQTQFTELTPQKALWAIIRDRANAIAFNKYKVFMDSVMCDQKGISEAVKVRLNFDPSELVFRGTEAYEILRKATEAFLMQESGLLPRPDDPMDAYPIGDPQEEKRRLPQLEGTSDAEIRAEMEANRAAYLTQLDKESVTFPYFALIRERLSDIPLKPKGADSEACYGILRTRVSPPVLLELIWSYWHEEGMLVQSLKAVGMRFQNRAHNASNGKHPLGHLNLDPLRPLGNLLWGYIQDEHNHLTVGRRAYEYDHHYGFTIAGRAVPKLNPADSRTKFLGAFHTLLHRVSAFYKEQADTTKVPDGYPILNGLKECHLLLAEGAHNQFGDLPWQARIEMLIEQWLMARPEMRDFLSRRTMVPYPEEWMPAVDQMKTLQNWTGVTVRHFRDLGVFGEMILLSIRYGNWSESFDENEAKVWTQYWRQEIQGYINAYRAATGVDLSADADLASTSLARQRAQAPSELLAQRARADGQGT